MRSDQVTLTEPYHQSGLLKQKNHVDSHVFSHHQGAVGWLCDLSVSRSKGGVFCCEMGECSHFCSLDNTNPVVSRFSRISRIEAGIMMELIELSSAVVGGGRGGCELRVVGSSHFTIVTHTHTHTHTAPLHFERYKWLEKDRCCTTLPLYMWPCISDGGRTDGRLAHLV